MNRTPAVKAAESPDALSVTSIGSGSSGNALLFRSGRATLLVDCGVGVRRMTRVFASQGLDVSTVDALLLSHEHSDHVCELPRFVKLGTTILATKGTAAAAQVPAGRLETMLPRETKAVAGVEVAAIPVSHDASEPCGFLIRASGGTVTVLTDLGRASGHAVEAIAESDLVVLEANHDEEILRRGPYPLHLQRRILSDSGHLSNRDCAELLATALRGSRRPPTIWLAHLSETNNRPSIAVRTVERRLAQVGLRLDVHALPRREANTGWQPGFGNTGQVQLMLDFD